MFLRNPEQSITEEHSRDSIEEYYLIYQYRVPKNVAQEFFPSEHSFPTQSGTKNIPLNAQTESSRNLFFFPDKNKKITQKTKNKMEKFGENFRQNFFMPLKSAIFILKNSFLISDFLFLELLRAAKILKSRLLLRSEFRLSVEMIYVKKIIEMLRAVDVLEDKEVR